MSRRSISFVSAVSIPLVALGAAPAAAAPPDQMPEKSGGAEVYQVNLDELNASGVSGKAVLVLREGTLRIHLHARGLVAGMVHPQHIHGLDASANATCPPPSASGEDTLITLPEGLPFYGPVLLPLEPFPTPDDGTVNYHETFQVDGDLEDLSDEAIVLHGAFLDGTYDPTLPVACGEID